MTTEDQKPPPDDGATYYVLRQRPCPACDGEGRVRMAIWDDYRAAEEAEYGPGGFKGPSVSTESAEFHRWHDDWWKQAGYPGYLPPEETRCDECDGTKVCIDQAPLREAILACMPEFVPTAVNIDPRGGFIRGVAGAALSDKQWSLRMKTEVKP